MATYLQLGDVKPFLNLKDTSNDAQISVVITAAEAYVGNKCGPLLPATTTVRVAPGNDDYLRVPGPIVSVTSVTALESGTAYTIDTEDIDNRAGVILADVEFEEPLFEVVYSAGWSTVPDDLKQAAIYAVAWLWRAERGSGSRQGEGPTNYKALADALMAPYMRPTF